MKPPCKDYRLNPRFPDAKITISSRGWLVTPETLTDRQAFFMINCEGYEDPKMIMTIAEFDKEIKEIAKEDRAKKKAVKK